MCNAYYKDYFENGEEPIVYDGCMALEAAAFECHSRFDFVPRSYDEYLEAKQSDDHYDDIPF